MTPFYRVYRHHPCSVQRRGSGGHRMAILMFFRFYRDGTYTLHHLFRYGWIGPKSTGLVWGLATTRAQSATTLHSSNEPGELSQWLWSWWQHHKHCHGYYLIWWCGVESTFDAKFHTTSARVAWWGNSTPKMSIERAMPKVQFCLSDKKAFELCWLWYHWMRRIVVCAAELNFVFTPLGGTTTGWRRWNML